VVLDDEESKSVIEYKNPRHFDYNQIAVKEVKSNEAKSKERWEKPEWQFQTSVPQLTIKTSK
jgi:hypothetical protein